MPSYHVFGGVLRSELEFPELDVAASGPFDWTLDIAAGPAPAIGDAERLGEDTVDQGVMVRAFRLASGYRLDYDDTGVFDIDATGGEIRWHPPDGVDHEAVRLDVLGRVLAMALHASGWLSLHGSAVAMDGGAAAFLAPKGNGKSTLAFALMRAGGALMTDDTVLVGEGSPPVLRPGVQSVRLFRDSADWLDAREPIAGADSKATFAALSLESRRALRAPLGALYLLESVPAGSIDGPVARERLFGPAAVVGVLAQTKIGNLLGGSQAAGVFGSVVALAESTAVFRLRVTRDYEQLSAVVAQLASWHGGISRTATPPASQLVPSAS